MIPDISTLRPIDLVRASSAFTTWHHLAKIGTTTDHVMDPDYWGNFAGRLLRTPNKGVGDVIRVRAEDGTFDVWVTVVEVDTRGLWARVRPLDLFHQSKEGPQLVDSADYLVEFGDIDSKGVKKWRIIDRAGTVVEKGMPTKEAAHAKLAEIRREKKAA